MLLAFYLLIQCRECKARCAWAERRWLQLSIKRMRTPDFLEPVTSHGLRGPPFSEWAAPPSGQECLGPKAECDTGGSKRGQRGLCCVCVGVPSASPRSLTGSALALAAHEAVLCVPQQLPSMATAKPRVCAACGLPLTLAPLSLSTDVLWALDTQHTVLIYPKPVPLSEGS